MAALVFGCSLTMSSLQGQPTPAPAATTSPWWLAPEDPRAYIGSRACGACHDEEHDDWHRSLHVQMTRPIGETEVRGDFASGARLDANGRRYQMSTRDGRRYIAVSHGGRPFEEFEAQYTLGALRVQGYLSTLPDGRIYVLPAFWHLGEKRWIDWKEITPVPDSDHDLRQIWNVNCFNCHATNLEQRFDVAARRFDTRWSEMGVTCEACHGPGKAHADLMERWEALRVRGVTSPPEAVVREPGVGSQEPGRRSRRLRIFAAKSADRRQVFDLCAYCHGNKNNVFTGFLPGDRYEDYALPFLVSQPPPTDDPQGDYWPDGRPSRFNRPQALTLSGCFLQGAATCTNCHVAHGSPNAHSLKVPIARSDDLCTQCHKDKGSGERAGSIALQPVASGQKPVDAHTHHPAASEGSRCINCHMSDVNWRLLIRRRDHTFQPPTPEITARYGAPNACTECHENRSPEWASAQLDRWYGHDDAERRRRALGVADAFYGAAARDPEAPRRLAALLVDRTHGALVRASAADALGRLLVQGVRAAAAAESQTSFADERQATSAETARPASAASTPPAAPTLEPAARALLVNALLGGAADPEPMVRATATQALGLAGDARATMPLVARLADPARLVRVHAAEALLGLGVVQLPGAAGESLSRAQDEYAASLGAFPDRVDDHVSRGWLEMQRGAEARAIEALGVATTLDPSHRRARVLLGIIDARNGRYRAALERWRSVRRADPRYPNIDRLIEEAERREGRP
jgi:predicted CXXCH cytochrome family protein